MNLLENSDSLGNNNLLRVEKHDMTPRIINYKDDEILNIVSNELFEENNNVKTEYANHFNTNELLALKESASKIKDTFKEKIKDADNLKKAFVKIQSNYIRILKILNRKVKKFEVNKQDKNNLSDFEGAVVDQFEKIKYAIIFFEYAEWNLEKNLNNNSQTLCDLIKNQKIEFKLPQLNVNLESLESVRGCLSEVKFFNRTDGKSCCIKKDPFVVEKKSIKFNFFPQDSRHRQSKKIGAYGHFESKGQQFIIDGVSRQKGEQTIAKALSWDCVAETKACLVNGEIWTYMENAKNPMPGDKEIFYGNQVLFCLDDNELNEARDFIENKTLIVKDKNSKDLNKRNVNQNIKMKDFFVAKTVTKKTLIEMSKLSILDFICGQFDRHSGNFVVHFDKDGNAKFKLFDNDGNFQVNMSKSEMKQMLKEKVPIVPKSFIINLLIFGATYKQDTKQELEAQIGKVGDFENEQNTSLAVRETEKRIIMLFKHVFKIESENINEIGNFCNRALECIHNGCYTHTIDSNETDREKQIITEVREAMVGELRERLISFIYQLPVNKQIVIDDSKIDVTKHGKLFLQMEPDGWFWRLLYKIFDSVKYIFYRKKGNGFSATHCETREYLINKQLPNCDQQLVLNEKNKIENCKVNQDDSINLSTETNKKPTVLYENKISGIGKDNKI